MADRGRLGAVMDGIAALSMTVASITMVWYLVFRMPDAARIRKLGAIMVANACAALVAGEIAPRSRSLGSEGTNAHYRGSSPGQRFSSRLAFEHSVARYRDVMDGTPRAWSDGLGARSVQRERSIIISRYSLPLARQLRDQRVMVLTPAAQRRRVAAEIVAIQQSRSCAGRVGASVTRQGRSMRLRSLDLASKSFAAALPHRTSA